MWMGMWPDGAIYIPWDVWIATWIVAAVWAKPAVRRAGLLQELPYRIVTLAGFALMFAESVRMVAGHIEIANAPGILGERYWLPPLAVGWAMVGLAALGFLFALWARIQLGTLWSGTITRKDGHVLVQSGPYAIVRHPIYTGLLVACIATVVATGMLHTMLGALLLTLGHWMKARQEERFLAKELGAAEYESYRRRVPMLIPFLR